MPTFEFTSPEGKTYEIDGPEGATPEQAFAILNQHLGTPQPQGGGIIDAIKGAPGSMVDTAKSMGQTVADSFNPNSDAKKAYYDKQKNASFMEGIGLQLGDLMNVGKSLGAAATIIPSTLTAPVVKVGGAMFDAASPNFSEADKQKLAAAGVKPISGEEAVSTALMAARPAGANPIGLTTKAAPVPSVADLKDAYKTVREGPAVKGTTVPAADVANVQTSIINDLTKAGYRPTTASAPGTFAELENLAPPSAKVNVLGGTVDVPRSTFPVQMDDLLAARRALGRYAGQTLEGKPTPDASAATHAMRKLDSFIEQYVPQMKDANANYAAAKRAESFDLRGQKAINNSDAANSGMNLENQLRSQVRQILNNPKLQRGLDSETLDAMRKFNSGSRSANVVRIVGNILGGGGGWGAAASSAIGYLFGGPVGAILAPALGVATKAAGNARALSQFDHLGQMMRSASPLARNAAPVPIGAPNPVLGSLPIAQLPAGLGLRPLLGVVPSAADEQKKKSAR